MGIACCRISSFANHLSDSTWAAARVGPNTRTPALPPAGRPTPPPAGPRGRPRPGRPAPAATAFSIALPGLLASPGRLSATWAVPGLPGRHSSRFILRRVGQLPGQGVFPSAAAHDQHVHARTLARRPDRWKRRPLTGSAKLSGSETPAGVPRGGVSPSPLPLTPRRHLAPRRKNHRQMNTGQTTRHGYKKPAGLPGFTAPSPAQQWGGPNRRSRRRNQSGSLQPVQPVVRPSSVEASVGAELIRARSLPGRPAPRLGGGSRSCTQLWLERFPPPRGGVWAKPTALPWVRSATSSFGAKRLPGRGGRWRPADGEPRPSRGQTGVPRNTSPLDLWVDPAHLCWAMVLLSGPVSATVRDVRGVAQLGRALDWGSRGRRFKSCRPDLA